MDKIAAMIPWSEFFTTHMTKEPTETLELVRYRMVQQLLRDATREIERVFTRRDETQARGGLAHVVTLLQTAAAELRQAQPAPVAYAVDEWEAHGRALRRWAEALSAVLYVQRPTAIKQASRGRKVLKLVLVLGVVLVSVVMGEWRRWRSPAGLQVTYFFDCQLQQSAWGGVEMQLARNFRDWPPVWWTRPGGFSSRWRGLLAVPQDDQYTFNTQNCDGLRFYLDGKCVIDNWRDQAWEASGREVRLQLSKGAHPLVVEHYCRTTREGALRVCWRGGGIPENTLLAAPYLRKRP
ncbi:MAG: hypothetical protein EPN23_05575 [Verrucomicrobia bacterium]|nr:MAG: hypothetical protein EPN23_05575 [Verrucomicrobiota bacterium]